MSRILAIDTTSEFGSIALVQEDRVLLEEVLLARHPTASGHVICMATSSGLLQAGTACRN